MRKKRKLLYGLLIVALLFGVLSGLRFYQKQSVIVTPSDYEELKFLALEYEIAINNWDQDTVLDAMGTHRIPCSYGVLYGSSLDPQSRRIIKRLEQRFSKIQFAYTDKKGKSRTGVTAWLEASEVDYDKKGVPYIEIKENYNEPFGGICGSSPTIKFRRSLFGWKWKPMTDGGFFASACQ